MKIEYIKWIDSFGCGTNWNEIGDIKTEPVFVVSVGYIKETDDYVVVIPHYAEGTIHTEANGCGDMAIPKVSIKERIVLKETT